jgi:hypothetical protein
MYLAKMYDIKYDLFWTLSVGFSANRKPEFLCVVKCQEGNIRTQLGPLEVVVEVTGALRRIDNTYI